ncbi:MAG: cache domain-containing protein [Afipia sp.]|nr:cache domain-containing protein [Afipia sp.]OJW63195.1 MAG: chemotaxis protein [Afipia sp. 64-13]
MKFFHLSIGSKIYAIIFIAVVGSVVATGLTFSDARSGLEGQKRIELKHLTELAYGIIEEEYAAAAKNTISTEEAQKRAAARVAALRYGQGDYFWINDMHPRMIMHPMRPELNGKDLTENKDPNGKPLFMEMIDVVKRGGAGFVPYEWPKPGMDKPQPKLSHVVGFAPWGWIVGTGVYVDDLQTQIWNMIRRALVITGVITLISGALAIFIARRTSAALKASTNAMRQLADGDFSIVLPGLNRKDEIGEIAGAVEAFKVKMTEKVEHEAQAKTEADRAVALERKQAMMQLADSFEQAVGDIVETVSLASSELEAAAGTLTSTAETTQRLSATVAEASEQASVSVQSVASASNEMTSSVNEIGRQVQEAARIAGAAVSQADTTNDRVNKLSQAAGRIGDVVELINTIAGQTNLLALNATIEAARAGDAGRGFAVVASEVKALAQQTAQATGEIIHQVTGIQAATEESVVAIREISGTISRISEISSAIASAVEEQGAATQEISRNIMQSAEGTHQVATNIVSVKDGANETGAASSQVLASARMLSNDSARLKAEVDRFLATIRAA